MVFGWLTAATVYFHATCHSNKSENLNLTRWSKEYFDVNLEQTLALGNTHQQRGISLG
jgi:hypothetical protein